MIFVGNKLLFFSKKAYIIQIFPDLFKLKFFSSADIIYKKNSADKLVKVLPYIKKIKGRTFTEYEAESIACMLEDLSNFICNLEKEYMQIKPKDSFFFINIFYYKAKVEVVEKIIKILNKEVKV